MLPGLTFPDRDIERFPEPFSYNNPDDDNVGDDAGPELRNAMGRAKEHGRETPGGESSVMRLCGFRIDACTAAGCFGREDFAVRAVRAVRAGRSAEIVDLSLCMRCT